MGYNIKNKSKSKKLKLNWYEKTVITKEKNREAC